MADAAACPWCGYSSHDTYAIQLHIEEQHTDDSPFAVSRDSPKADSGRRGGRSEADFSEFSQSSERWVKCTRKGCGEYVAQAHLDEHLDLHDDVAAAEPKVRNRRGSPRVLNGTGYDKPRVSSQKATSQVSTSRSSASGWVRSRAPNDRPRSLFSTSRSSVSGHARAQVESEKAPSQAPSSKSSAHKSKPPSEKAGSHVSSAKSSAHGSKAPSEKASSHVSSAKSSAHGSRVPSDKASSHVSSSKSSVSSKSRATSNTSVGSSVGPKDALKQHQNPGRLGTKELGTHAFEKSMPPSVRRVLENASKPSYECRIGPNGKLQREAIVYNEPPRPIPILADLSALDPNTTIAYFSHKSVKHVHRLKCDGNFCGYWNIQMLLSYRLARIEDPAHGNLPLPNVLEIQDTIEAAWDAGTCSFGRTETGGIRNTRKWIGTHEAAAYFLHLGQPVTALSFRAPSDPKAPPAHEQLLDYVEAYYISGLEHVFENGSSRMTMLPPIYFQRPGHSMTIVGMERRGDGERVLLVFDPSFAALEMMRQVRHGRVERGKVASLMAPYRQDGKKLAQWREYEILIPQASK